MINGILGNLWRFWKTQNHARLRMGEPLAEVSSEDQKFLDDCLIYLQGLEELRLEQVQLYNKRKRIVKPSVVVIVLLFLCLVFLAPGFVIIITIFALSSIITWMFLPHILYAKLYKEQILPKLIRVFGDFEYRTHGRISMDGMEPSEIVPKHDRYRSEDYFKGAYKGCVVEFSEIHLEKEYRTKNGGRNYTTVFRGLAILIGMQSKTFYGHTILEQDQYKIAEWFRAKTTKFKKANLVDPKFEDIFDVFTTDQVEARYLIDPVIMERLLEINQEYNGKGLRAAFYRNQLLVLVESEQNFFEPAHIDVSATDPRSVLSMKKEIGQILSLIDRLDLYEPAKVHARADQR